MAVPALGSQDHHKSQQEVREKLALVLAFLLVLLIQRSLGHFAVHLWFPSPPRILLNVFLVTNAAEIQPGSILFFLWAISEHLWFPGWQGRSRRLTWLFLNGDAQLCQSISPLWKHHGKAWWFSKKGKSQKLYRSAIKQDPLCHVGGPYEKNYHRVTLYYQKKPKPQILKQPNNEQFKKISLQVPLHQWATFPRASPKTAWKYQKCSFEKESHFKNYL